MHKDFVPNPSDPSINNDDLRKMDAKAIYFDYTVLKNRRMELGYTQKDVADAVDVTARAYQKWERGENVPNATFMVRLMVFLGVFNFEQVITISDSSIECGGNEFSGMD